MKHFTFLCTLALGFTVTAQAQSFVKIDQTANEEKFMPVHRGIVSFADIDGDGRLDVIYGGQYRRDDRYNGQGDVTYEATLKEGEDPNNNDSYEPVLDEEGNLIVKSHTKWAILQDPNNPNSWVSQSWSCTANIFFNQGGGNYTHESGSSYWHWGQGDNVSTVAHGLLPTTWGGYYFFDANNDGRLDAYIYGQDEWGWDYAQKTGQSAEYNLFSAFQIQNAEGIFELQPLPFPGGSRNENLASLGNRANSSFAVGDYDHDGYNDVLIECYHQWKEDEEVRGERMVALFHNNGDGTFTEARVFNPLPYDVNPQRSGVFYVDEDDLEAENPYKPTYKARPTSHGAIAFGDLNGDGWLDIIVTGYCDDGLTFTIYKNNQDGTFDEVDLTDKGFLPVYESEVRVADMNNDGWLDIVVFGTQDGSDMPKVGDVYLNGGDGEFNFARSSVEEGNGLYGASASYATLVDFDHDGLTDVFSYGWTNVENKGWGARIHRQLTDGTFELDYEFGDPNTAHLAVGDVNGDGSLDVSGDYWYDFGIWENQVTDGIEAPEAPTDVKAEYADGKLTVKWAGDENELGYGYNLYVRNTATGWISQLIPADLQTGALRTQDNLGVALRSEEPADMSYTLTVPEGTYEVGVQAIKADWTTSTFTKATISVGSGIQSTSAIASEQTRVYDANGLYVGNTTDGLRHGLYLVKKGNKTTKVVK